MNEQSERIKWLEATRGGACLIVVFAHILSTHPRYGIYASGCGKIGVWLFMLMTGMFCIYPFLHKKFTIKDIPGFYLKKIIRIYPAFIVGMMIAYSLELITLEDIFKMLTMQAAWGHFWYIPVVIKFYLIAPIFLLLFSQLKERSNKGTLVFVVICGAAILISVLLFPYHTYIENSILLRWYLPVLIFGMILALIIFEPKKMILSKLSWSMVVVSLGIMLCLTPAGRKILFGAEPSGWLQNKYLLIGALWSVILLAVGLEDAKSKWSVKNILSKCRILQFIAGCSYEIYIVHYVIMCKSARSGSYSWIQLALITLIASLVIGWILNIIWKTCKKKKVYTGIMFGCLAILLILIVIIDGKKSHFIAQISAADEDLLVDEHAVEDEGTSFESVLYVPTMINKVEDTYFIIDCWQHRVLYNTQLDSRLTNWKVMTDESYVGGHSVASDGEFYLLDNTDMGQVLVYQKDENGDFIRVKTFQAGGESARPHFVSYDEENKLFYVIGSTNGTIYVFENQSGQIVLVRQDELSELLGGYVRSISIIDGDLYTVSGNSMICRYDISQDGFCLASTYAVPDDFAGMNQIVKIEDYYYITVNTDIYGDVSKTNIICVKDLEQLATNEYESLYEDMGFVGQPYFITEFDDRYYITQISATKGNGIKSFEVVDNEVTNVTDLFYWDDVSEASIERYESKYVIKDADNNEEREVVDLFLFCGQSNMAGKGNAKDAPYVANGYEFRPMTNQSGLYHIFEPFGINQINPDGINDSWPATGELRKMGGMVSTFANSYYDNTGTSIVGVSCSEGATTISQWMPGGGKYEDIVYRCNLAKQYLENSQSYELRYVYMVWCQGESDGDIGTSYEDYYAMLNQITSSLVEQDIVDKCMIIRTGNNRNDGDLYKEIQQAQSDLCNDSEDCILISDLAPAFVEEGLMSDVYHYTQEGYNLLGEDAGKNAAKYTNQMIDNQ